MSKAHKVPLKIVSVETKSYCENALYMHHKGTVFCRGATQFNVWIELKKRAGRRDEPRVHPAGGCSLPAAFSLREGN